MTLLRIGRKTYNLDQVLWYEEFPRGSALGKFLEKKPDHPDEDVFRLRIRFRGIADHVRLEGDQAESFVRMVSSFVGDRVIEGETPPDPGPGSD